MRSFTYKQKNIKCWKSRRKTIQINFLKKKKNYFKRNHSFETKEVEPSPEQ